MLNERLGVGIISDDEDSEESDIIEENGDEAMDIEAEDDIVMDDDNDLHYNGEITNDRSHRFAR